jgi:hypothetical protein
MKPIIFNAESVRAILDGRKTQTRRVVKPQPPTDEFGTSYVGPVYGPEMYNPVKIDRHGEMYPGAPVYGVYDEDGEWGAKCPFGQPGDTLWVREAILPKDHQYAADFSKITIPDHDAHNWCFFYSRYCCPSIHMPRWASRITLKITDVRVERLQDISEADALAEGCRSQIQHSALFADMWDEINAKRGYPWESNPWVWVLEFSREGT